MKRRFAASLAIGALLLPQTALAQGALIIPDEGGSSPTTTSIAPLIRPGDDSGPSTSVAPLIRMGEDGEEGETGEETETTSSESQEPSSSAEQEPLTADFVESRFEDRGTHRYLDATCNLGQFLNEYRAEFGKDPKECTPGETVEQQAPETSEQRDQVDDDVSSSTSEEAAPPVTDTTTESSDPTEETTPEAPPATETTTEAPEPATETPSATENAAPPAAPPVSPSTTQAPPSTTTPENGGDATESIRKAAADARAVITEYLAVNQGTINPEDGEMFTSLFLLAQTDGSDVSVLAEEAGEHGDTVEEFANSNADSIPDWKQRMDLDAQLSQVGTWGEGIGVNSASALQESYDAMKAAIDGGN